MCLARIPSARREARRRGCSGSPRAGSLQTRASLGQRALSTPARPHPSPSRQGTGNDGPAPRSSQSRPGRGNRAVGPGLGGRGEDRSCAWSPSRGPLCQQGCWAVGAPDPLSTWRAHRACTGCCPPKPGQFSAAGSPRQPRCWLGWEQPLRAYGPGRRPGDCPAAIPSLRLKPPSLLASDLVLELLACPLQPLLDHRGGRFPQWLRGDSGGAVLEHHSHVTASGLVSAMEVTGGREGGVAGVRAGSERQGDDVLDEVEGGDQGD